MSDAGGTWSAEMIEQLRTLWAEGISTAAIARRLGLTKNAVVGKAHRLPLPSRPTPIASAPRTGRRPHPAAERIVSLPAFMRPLAAPPAPTAPAVPPAASAVPPVLPQEACAPPPPSRECCCWPEGHPGTPGFRFCGAAAMPNRPYCARHAALAYVPIRSGGSVHG